MYIAACRKWYNTIILRIAAGSVLIFPSPGWGIDVATLARNVEAQAATLMQAHPEAIGASRITVSAAGIDSRLQLADCPIPLFYDISSYQGGNRLAVRVSCNSGNPWAIYVPVEVSIYRSVVVTATAIPRNTPVTPDMVTFAETNVATDNHGAYIVDMKHVQDMHTRRDLGPGEVLQPAALEKPRVVRRGQAVQVLASNGTIAVKTVATALGNGRMGDRIRVQNVDSKLIFEALVSGPGQVQVPL